MPKRLSRRRTTVIAVYGPLGLMTPLGWKWALLVWVYALAWFLFEDRVKLLAYRMFDPEQPPLLRQGTLAPQP
jgi:H+-transporting ATPase